MRLFQSALVTALIVPLAAQAHSPDSCPAPEPAPMRWQLVGFTSSTLLGDSGVLNKTLACQQDFVGSRMCSSTEVLETVAVPLGLVGSAWVRPSFAPFHGVGTLVSALDVSGYATSVTNLTCRTSAFVMTASGDFTISQCANELAVACCALVP